MVDVEGGVVADECVVFVERAVVVGDGLVKGGVVNVEGDVAVKIALFLVLKMAALL